MLWSGQKLALNQQGTSRQKFFNRMTWPVFLVVAVALLHQVSAEDCPARFLRYSSTHSYCRPKNQSCDIMAFYETEDDIQEILKLHNSYRSMVATGQSSLPRAADMLELQWDEQLAAVAQKYADQCLYKHDCSACRRVRNFGVGQNLAMQVVSGENIPPPSPDWKFAVNIWFSEILYFQSSNICPFNPPGLNEYRHFSELVWAKSFRVGCGYVLFKTESSMMIQSYTRLYVCNYGPNGNIYGKCVYRQGDPCTKCPLNSCCGRSCGSEKKFDGLCAVKPRESPKYAAPKPNLFYCGFQEEADCGNHIQGSPNWLIEHTRGDNYLEGVFDGGDNSTIIFKNHFQPKESDFCITLKYRKGPNIAGKPEVNSALLIAYAPSINYKASEMLKSYPVDTRQAFSTYNLTISWNYETQIQLSFAVPKGKPAQFFDVKSILVTDGKCQN